MDPLSLFNIFWSMNDFENCLIIANEFESKVLLQKMIHRLSFKYLSYESYLNSHDKKLTEILEIQNELTEIRLYLDKIVLIPLSIKKYSFYPTERNYKIDLLNVFIEIKLK